MSISRIRWLAGGAALLILLLGYLLSSRSATIVLNGEESTISTRALTVSGALNAAGIEIGPNDKLEPCKFSLLKNGMMINISRAIQFNILADEEFIQLNSTMRNPIALLLAAEIDMQSADRLLINGESLNMLEALPNTAVQNLEVRRAHSISIIEDDNESQILTSALTVAEALRENGFILYLGDIISPSLEESISEGLIVHLFRAEAIEIIIGEESLLIRSAESTVGDALAQAGIALQGLDYSQPNSSEAIPEPRRIEIIRVVETVELQSSIIPFDVEWQADPNTEIDERSVLQAGQNGVRASSLRVRYENGQEVSRTNEGEWTLSEPVTQISGFGTKIVVRSAVVDGVNIEYWRTLELFATSYSPCRSGVEKCYYGTSGGEAVQKGIAAVYYNWWLSMNIHTVYVPGYGPAMISDVGAYPDGRPWIDLAYSDEDWVTWGDWVTVYFTTPIPPLSEVLYLLP